MQFAQSFLLVSSSMFFLFIVFYSLVHRNVAGAYQLAALMFAAVIWSMGSYFELYSSTFQYKLFWRNIQQIGVFSVPIITIHFAMVYTMNDKMKKYVYLVTLVPLASVLLIFTDEYHHIMRTYCTMENSLLFGPTLVVHSTTVGSLLVAFNFSLPIVAIIILLEFGMRVSVRFRKQVSLIIISFLLTFVVSWVKMAILDQIGIYIYISVLYIPSAFILFYSLFKYKFFSLSPIARDKVFEVISQGILVADQDGYIVEINSYAQNLLSEYTGFIKSYRSLIGSKIDSVFSFLPDFNELLDMSEETVKEIEINKESDKQYLLLNYYPLRNFGIDVIGAVWILNDITSQKLYEFSLKERADKDGLTHLLNRSGFQNAYEKEKHNLYVNNLPVSILMIDLDYFKNINDTYGHINGDRVLLHFSNLIKKSLKNEDIIGRIGGEEFAVIISGVNKEEAYNIAERIRKKIACSKVILLEGESIQYTISIGIADNYDVNKSLNDILHEADIALYQAKENSRNCSVIR
nr:diguanylate cyclase [Sedimentibacter sp.]